MSERGDVDGSLYAALTNPITKTFAERKLGLPRGFSLDVIQDFMMPTQNDEQNRKMLEIAKKTLEIERQNLLALTQLVVKEVIETSMPLDRTVTGTFQPLGHLFSLLEQILKHGFKSRKAVLGSRNIDIWNILENLEKFCPQSKEVTESCRNLPLVETNLGKVRAWIRLSLMQKKLPDYFKALVDHKDVLLANHYDSGAVLMSDEASVIAGLLVGLNFIDYNLCVRDEELDSDYQIISLLSYLKTRSQPEMESPQTDVEVGLKAILDQKNYLEELNSNLKLQMNNLEVKLDLLTISNTHLTSRLEEARKESQLVQQENSELKITHENMQKSTQEDLTTERETNRQSHQGLDSVNSTLQMKLDREVSQKLEMERELRLQTNIRTEKETAVKLMEREVEEKEHLICIFRKQLDDLKLVNLEMYQKLQTAENALRHKTDLVSRMEQKMEHMGETMNQLGQKIQMLDNERRSAEETARKLTMQLAETDVTRSVLETDLRMEQEQKASLIGSLTEREDKLQHLLGEVQSIRNISQNYEQLRSEHEFLQKMSQEQEEALAELGNHLSEQKVKVAEMKDLTNQFDPTALQWEKDAVNCKLCEKAFTVARRKHHCRHCGQIFCHSCSDNKISLPSSAKPVRVCDNCHILLLRRYSSK